MVVISLKIHQVKYLTLLIRSHISGDNIKNIINLEILDQFQSGISQLKDKNSEELEKLIFESKDIIRRQEKKHLQVNHK